MVFISSKIKVDKIQNTIISEHAPSYPTIGQLWNDTGLNPPVLKVWNGSEWIPVNMSVEQLDPVTMDKINETIQDTINEVNSSRNEIDEALKQAQDAVDKANIASGNVEKVTADVADAKKNAQDAIDKANLNDASITEIKKQQSEDGQKIADISQNFNGIQQSVTNLATKQESDRTQLAGMIQDKVSNEDFEASNTILADRIDEVISSSDGRFNAIQSTIDSTTQTIKGIDGRVTQNTTSINGINTTVQNKADKTEVTQLAGQISETVENQEATNQRVATAEQNISALTTADGNQNKRLDTAEKSIQTISTKTDNNTELINETKKTVDSNSSKIVDTSGRVSTVEQTLTEQKQTIADNTGKINQAIQDIDSAERTISSIDGRVTKTEQSLDGVSSTVSKVQTDLNTTNTKLDNKADTSYVNNKVDGISIGGTNILKNTEKMDNSTGNYWVSEGNVTLQDGVATVKQTWASREYLLDDLNKYIENNDVKNKKYILSVDIMRTTQDVISNSQIRFYLEQSGSHAAILVDDLSKLPINKWVRKSVPIILLGQNENSLTRGRFRIECTTNNEWKFRRMQLEEGTKATDWSPSPEDNASQSDLNATNNKVNNKANQADLNNTNNRLNGVDSNLNGLLNTGTNCWINSNFADGLNHWTKNVADSMIDINETYQGTKVLHFKADTSVGWGYIGTKDRYKVTPGEKISFSWLQNKISGSTVYGEIQTYPDEKSGRNGAVSVYPSDGTLNKWVKVLKEGYVVPNNVNYIGVNFYINGTGEIKITQPQMVHGSKVPPYQGSVSDLNNAKNDINANKTQIQSQQTQINQTSGKVDIIASTNGNANAYFNINTNGDINIGASHRLVLSANTYVTDGFTFSANNIKAGIIKGNNMSIDLDKGNVLTTGSFGTTTFKSGGLLFEDNNTHTQYTVATSGRRLSICRNNSVAGYDLRDAAPFVYNASNYIDVGGGYVRIAAGSNMITLNNDQIEISYGNHRITCRGGDIKFEMNGLSWYMKKQTFNGNNYPTLVSSTGNSGFALGGNVPYVKSDGKWYSLNQVITKTGVKPVG